MLIGIDIDEVLADLVSPLIRFHNKNYHTSLKRGDIFCYQLRYVWRCSEEEEYRRVIEFYHSPYFKEIKPVKGSVKGVKKLKEEEHDLVIITSRHSKGRDGTTGWIETYFPRMFSDIYFSDYYKKERNIAKTLSSHVGFWDAQKSERISDMTRKAGICKEKGIDMLIEDSLDNARDCVSERTRVILLDCPWNRCKENMMPEGVSRVYSWREIVDNVLLSK